MLPYLSKVPDIKKVEGLEQLAFLHAEYVTACCQESPYILQTQELGWGDRKGFICERVILKCTTCMTATNYMMCYYLSFSFFKELRVYFFLSLNWVWRLAAFLFCLLAFTPAAAVDLGDPLEDHSSKR